MQKNVVRRRVASASTKTWCKTEVGGAEVAAGKAVKTCAVEAALIEWQDK